MRHAMPRCQKWHTESCVDVYDAMSCEAAVIFCASELQQGAVSLISPGEHHDMLRLRPEGERAIARNPYDLSQQCPESGACGITREYVVCA